MTKLVRETRETRIELTLDTSTDGPSRLDVPDRVLRHMLETLARYAGWSLELTATGDLRHHLIEDVALTLGAALVTAIPEACVRYASVLLPMDDALVGVALDVGGRPWYTGPLPSRLYDHFFRSLADSAGLTLHVEVRRGTDRHHVIEAAFKALGLCFRDALRPAGAVFSTKGSIRLIRDGVP
jgi:imidazoleglycerol-phosphate dehydratase